MSKNIKNQQGGFLRLILAIVILIFTMLYFHITFSDIINWMVTTVQNIFS